MKPGGGICIRCEIMVLIDLSFDRMKAALCGEIPVTGKRLPVSREKVSK